MLKEREISLKSIFSLAIPMMFASLSGTIYYFADKIILSKVSFEAMNAAVLAGNYCMTFWLSLVGLASITEVFVGQHNGAEQYDKIGQTVWQMIYVCLATSPIFFSIGIFAAPYLLSGDNYLYGSDYFRIMMFGGPIFGIGAAMSGFYFGRKRALFVMAVTIFSNLVNIVLNYVLVLGVAGFIYPMGVKGAAISSVLSQVIILAIYFADFFKEKHRNLYNTLSMALSKEMLEQVKIGLPSAVSYFIELAGWTAGLALIAAVSFNDHTVFSMTQSLIVLFFFLNEGLQKAVSTLSANAIGSNERNVLKLLVLKVFLVHVFFMMVLFVPFYLYPDLILWFYDTNNLNATLVDKLHLTWKVAFVYMFFDGLFWIFAGVLTAGGDTRSVMLINGMNIVIFYLFPVWFMGHYGLLDVVWAQALAAAYCMVNCICGYLRFKRSKWIKMDLSAEDI